MTESEDVKCSFCGNPPRSQPPGRLAVVLGPGANICAECVALCIVVLEEQAGAEEAKTVFRRRAEELHRRRSGPQESGNPCPLHGPHRPCPNPGHF